MGAGIAAHLLGGKRLHIPFANPPGIANHVGKNIRVGVTAHQLGINLDALQQMLIDRQTGNFVFREAKAQGNRVEIMAALLLRFVELTQIRGGYLNQGFEQFDGVIELCLIGTND